MIKETFRNKKKQVIIFIILFLFNIIVFFYFTKKIPFAIFLPSFEEKVPMQEVIIYLPNSDYTRFIQDNREIFIYDKIEHRVESIISELGSRTIHDNTQRAIPSGIRLRQVWVFEKIAFLDFSKTILTIKINNPDMEKFFIFGITQSILKNEPQIKAVKFLVQGQEIDILWGGVDLTLPITFRSG